MAKDVRILRIDPVRKTIATLFLKRGHRDITPELRRLCRARDVGEHVIMDKSGKSMLCIAGLNVDEGQPMWRLRGVEESAGVSVLCGRDKDGVIVSVPVTRDWALERIVWLEGEDPAATAARADEVLPLLDDDVRLALSRAVVMPGGAIWITHPDKAQVGGAMIALGLGDEATEGQRLTKLGEAVFDLLGEPVDGPETR